MDPEEVKEIEAAKVAAEAEVERLKADIVKKDEDLKKLQDKDLNFSNLRKTTEELQKQKEESEKKLVAEVESMKTKFTELENQTKKAQEERVNSLVAAYSGKDEELKKVILFNFEKVKGNAKTDEEINTAMKDAYILSTGGKADENVIKGVQGVSRSGARSPASSSTTISPELKQLSETFNQHLPENLKIKDEDLKNPKYAVKPGQSAESNYSL